MEWRASRTPVFGSVQDSTDAPLGGVGGSPYRGRVGALKRHSRRPSASPAQGCQLTPAFLQPSTCLQQMLARKQCTRGKGEPAQWPLGNALIEECGKPGDDHVPRTTVE